MINEEFVYCNVDFSTSEEMLTTVSKDLFIAGFVTDMYGKKIIEREKKYPTGLKLDGLNIAICHTDPEYVLKNTLFFVRPKHAIKFKNAETLEDIDVDLVIGLAFSSGEEHLKILSFLAGLLSDSLCIHKIKESNTPKQLVMTMKEIFRECE